MCSARRVAVVTLCALFIFRMDSDVEQVSLIIDFDGWGLKNRDHDLDKMMIDTIQNYYPERLGQCFLLNAPTVFKVAWAVVRPWLDKRTTSKVCNERPAYDICFSSSSSSTNAYSIYTVAIREQLGDGHCDVAAL